jgi:O-acetylhomoserine (thiol)-lyase
VPIHLTTSFVFESSDHAASLFNLERAGHVYSRISNPTNAVLEQRVSALEGGIGAITTSSGQAALHLAICTLMGAGSHIVASTALYGGSHNLLHYTLKRFGIDTTFVNPSDMDAWRAAVRPNTKSTRANSTSCRRSTRAFTTWCSAKKAPWAHSCSGRAAKACATSVPA